MSSFPKTPPCAAAILVAALVAGCARQDAKPDVTQGIEMEADAEATAEPDAGVTVSVTTDPPLPAPNLLPESLRDFAANIVFSKEKESVYRNVKGLVQPGRTYVLACEIKPSPEVSTAKTAGSAGLGCTLAFWSEDWKNVVSLHARGEGAGEWRRVVSPKATMPEWIHHGQLHVGLAYTGGSGEVRNIGLFEAGCALVIEARSDNGVAQVKVVDGGLATVFDTGVLDGAETAWIGRVEADAARDYSVYVIDRKGNVAVARTGE